MRMVHTLSYTCSFSIDVKEGTRQLLVSHFNIPTDRICRVRSITLVYSCINNSGTVFSYTVESHTSKDDATVRSPPLMVTTYPRRYVLRNPKSTDFAYLGTTSEVLSDITVYTAESAIPSSVSTFFLATVVMEFLPAQPLTKDLGVLPPVSGSPRSGGGEDDGDVSPFSVM